MKIKYFTALFSVMFLLAFTVIGAQDRVLIKPGTKNWLDTNMYFTCDFVKKPVLGVSVLRLQVFDKTGSRNNDFKITALSGMPGMRMHDTEETNIKQNKKGDYLYPIDVVMPGNWEIKINVYKKQANVFPGVIKFEVK